MKATMPVTPAGPMTARPPKKRPVHRCRRCPYFGPSGQCFDLRLKSGRCGDWVWYLRDGKQHRHLYVKSGDPRTPKQRYCRARFGAASRKYSHSLTPEERRACIVAGSKLRSRPRLRQSGPLNGQHYSIRRDYATPAAQTPSDAKKRRNPLQTKGISRSTSDPCRTSAGPLSHHQACPTPRVGNHKPGRAPRTPAKQKAWAVSRLHRRPRVTQSARQRSRRVCWAARRLSPRHCPRPWEGDVAMKVRERDSERGRSTTAWFTSFSGETVQARVEPEWRLDSGSIFAIFAAVEHFLHQVARVI